MGSGARFHGIQKASAKESAPLGGWITRGRPENVLAAEFRRQYIRRWGYHDALLKISWANL
jgi:hypothetical protein